LRFSTPAAADIVVHFSPLYSTAAGAATRGGGGGSLSLLRGTTAVAISVITGDGIG